MPRTTATAAITLAATALTASAGAPVYDQYELYLRTNFSVNPGGSFNIPPNNFVNSETISMADDSPNISVRIGVNSMGGAIPVSANGYTISVCCQGCVSKVQNDPAKYLAIARSQESGSTSYQPVSLSGSGCQSGKCH